MKKVNLIFGGSPLIYNELLNSFDTSFHELGYETEIIKMELDIKGKGYIVSDYTAPGDFNIVVDFKNRIKPNKGKDKFNVVLHWENNSRNDYDEWDLVLNGSEYKICKQSIYFPMGYSRSYDYQYDVSNVKEDIDISFFGKLRGPGNIRMEMINFINSTKYSEKKDRFKIYTKNLFNKERDIEIARTKINLNLKHWNECFFEAHRACLILCRGKLLLTESGYLGGYGYMEPYLMSFNKDNFEKLIDMFLNDKIRKEWCDYVRNELTTKHTFTKYIRELILERL